MAGRRPIPTALKVLEGNPGKRPLNTREPKPTKKAPPCPAWMEEEAKEEWNRLAGTMVKLGILTEVDMAAFASYCQSYARWKQAEEAISREGYAANTDKRQPSYVTVAQQYMKSMNRYASEFGLTPAARSRILAGSAAPSDGADDDMDALLSGKVG